MKDHAGAAQYRYYLSKDIVLLPVHSDGDPAFYAALSRFVTIEETNGVLTLNGVEPAVTITPSTPGRLYSENVKEQPGKYRPIEIIRINFEDGNDGFLEFAAAVNAPNTKSVDDRFKLLFDRDQQIRYKGRTYTVDYAGAERPYLTYTITIPAKGVKK